MVGIFFLFMQRFALILLYTIKALQIMKNQGFIAFLLLCLLTIGCYKDQDNSSEPITITEIPDTKINTTVYGIVVDEMGSRITDYSISVNGNSSSIMNDVFNIDLIQANKRHQHIAIIQDDQEIAFANVSLIENDYNKLQLTSFPRWEESSAVNSGNAFISNNIYEVNLLDEQQNNLVTYGVIESETTLQQMGQWATGKNMEDYFLDPISAFYYNNTQEKKSIATSYNTSINTGENIGLFHLDNNFHQWILIEQFSTSQTIINADADGYYMLANYSPATFIEGKVTYAQLPISYQNIELSTASNQTLNLTTSANGRWSTYVPIETLTTVSMHTPCGDLFFSEEEVFNQNSEIYATEMDQINTNDFLPLSFRTVNCSGEQIAKAGLHLDYGGQRSFFLYGEENVETVISTCGDIMVGAFDIETNMQGVSIDWSSEIDDEIGVLTTCADTEMGYSYLKINDESQLLPTFALSENAGIITLSAPDNTIRIKIKGTGLGAYQ